MLCGTTGLSLTDMSQSQKLNICFLVIIHVAVHDVKDVRAQKFPRTDFVLKLWLQLENEKNLLNT